MRKMGRVTALVSAGLFGAAVAGLPGLAGAQSGTNVTARDFAFAGPDGSAPAVVNVNPGDTVTFSYPAGYSRHDVHFTAAAPDSCTGSSAQVGAAPTLAVPGWSATCSFTAPGNYPFVCDLHAGMTGTIAVAGAAAATPTPMSTQTATTPALTHPAPAAPKPAASRLTAAAIQHGGRVRAQITIARAGSSLTATLGPAALGSRRLRGLRAGTLGFAVKLGQRGRRALAAKHRLGLTLAVKVTGPGVATTTLTRTVLLKP